MKKTLISNDVVHLIQSFIDRGSEIKKYNIKGYTNIRLGSVTIGFDKDINPSIFADDGINSDYMKMWKNDVGGVLMKELKKKNNDLYEISENSFKCLLKKIYDDEIEDFLERNLCHVRDENTNDLYCVIKAVKKGTSYIYNDYRNDYCYNNDVETKSDIEEVEENYEQNESVELF